VRAAPVLVETVNVIVPLPDPLFGFPIATQVSGLTALQLHVGADAVMAIVPLPPSGGIAAPGGAMEYVHGGGAAA
jgi:hypothetical protein